MAVNCQEIKKSIIQFTNKAADVIIH
jgi:hypothetical protein